MQVPWDGWKIAQASLTHQRRALSDDTELCWWAKLVHLRVRGALSSCLQQRQRISFHCFLGASWEQIAWGVSPGRIWAPDIPEAEQRTCPLLSLSIWPPSSKPPLLLFQWGPLSHSVISTFALGARAHYSKRPSEKTSPSLLKLLRWPLIIFRSIKCRLLPAASMASTTSPLSLLSPCSLTLGHIGPLSESPTTHRRFKAFAFAVLPLMPSPWFLDGWLFLLRAQIKCHFLRKHSEHTFLNPLPPIILPYFGAEMGCKIVLKLKYSMCGGFKIFLQICCC